MSSSPPRIGQPSSRESGNGSTRSRRRRRRRPPTPPPPPQEEPTTSTYNNNGGGVWPEPFVEALAIQVALDASRSLGRLAAAPTLAFLFQVCSTWRAVSRSELLWQNLVRLIWNHTILHRPTWRDEYIYHHRTARNFRQYHCSYATLRPSDHPPAAPPGEEEVAEQLPLFCLRLALSGDHLAAGFSDGLVRVFHLPTHLHLRTIHPLLRDHLGLFSRAVSGIVLLPRADRLIFASLNGDIHVVSPLAGLDMARRAYLGDVVNDGALVDFAGSDRFWVGLYAGVPGRAIRVWDAGSEELLFVGGSLTDPESVMGWHMLTELRPAEPVGRVRVASNELAICSTGLRILVLDLEAHAMVVGEEAARSGIIVGSVDAIDDVFVMVDARGVGRVRYTRTLREVCRLDRGPLRGAQLPGLLGCINSLYALMWTGGVVRVWDAEHGGYLYSFRERVGEVTAIAASERHVVASAEDTTIHLWDFGARSDGFTLLG